LGLVAQAEKGTLFLDEIEALTPKAQVALLRFLQDKTYRSLGGKTTKSADVRIVAASNESFDQLIGEQYFRTDLYYRLNLIPLKIPPLRERGEDILELTNYFVRVFQQQYQQPRKCLSQLSLEALQYHLWPGNVRELEATLHRAFLLCENDVITPADLFDQPIESLNRSAGDLMDLSFKEAKHIALKQFEQRYLSLLMNKFDRNISAAAMHSGKDRSSLSKLIKKHSL
jgi:transcriptional regulator with PAS, ATPase and Fis domain